MDRRQFLQHSTLATAALAAGCTGSSSSTDDTGAPADTDTDTDVDTDTDTDTDSDTGVQAECAETPSDIEGPYYVPDVPVRSNLDLYGESGDKLALEGTLTDTACVPLANAVVEIWHANPDGAYDNNSPEMRYRGQVATDSEGRFSFRTLKPGWYLNGQVYRPAHIHLKAWVNGVEQLTTQIYFEGDPHIKTDPWAQPALTIPLADDGNGNLSGTFDIALA